MSLVTAPTFVIGLGGIGNRVVRNLRERFLAADMEIPETVRLRSIDTADQEPDAAEALPDEMFTRIDDFDANQLLSRLGRYPEIEKWWQYRTGTYTLGFVQNGAQAARPVGRLAFYRKALLIRDVLLKDLQYPRRKEVEDRLIRSGLAELRLTPRVFIIGSVAGGTGAGTLIDTAFLVRYLLSTVGYEKATIHAILGLPSVVQIKVGGTDRDGGIDRKVNAYSTLREIDGLLSGKLPRQIEYHEDMAAFTPVPPLFDQVYLFTAKKERGVLFTQQEDVLLRVAHFVFAHIALATGETSLQILSNKGKFFTPSMRAAVNGLQAIYGTFGVEWLETPTFAFLNAWIQRIAADVARNVIDIEWMETRKRNLDEEVHKNLVGPTAPLDLALRAWAATPESILDCDGLPSVEAEFAQLSAAEKPDELRRAVSALDSRLPRIATELRSASRRLPTEEEIEAWTAVLAASLVRNGEFRMGGAIRTLRAAARLFDAITRDQIADVESADSVPVSTGGLFRKADTAAAIEWARRRYQHAVRTVILDGFGRTALALSHAARQRADQLEGLQAAVSSAVRELEADARGWEGHRATDVWMHDEDGIRAAVSAHATDVTKRVGEDVAESVAQRIATLPLAFDPVLRTTLSGEFKGAIKGALQRAAAESTERPENAVEKLLQRLRVCEPMAQVVAGDVEKEAILGRLAEDRFRLLVTSLPDDKLRDLQAAAEREVMAGRRDLSFQTIRVDDKFRDDALHLTLGWPLWAFSEVQECAQVYGRTRESNVEQTEFSRIMGECPELRDHRIEPVSEEDGKRLFALMVVAGKVNPRGIDDVVFDRSFFGIEAVARSLPDARKQFLGSSLIRTAQEWKELRRRDQGEFKAELLSQISRIREEVESPATPEVLRAELKTFCDVVEQEVSGWRGQ
jgi:hypothetical protein